MAKSPELRLKVVEAVKNGKTIDEITQTFGISVRTIRRWLKRYKEGGLEQLTKPRPYTPPWNITPDNIAKKVYLLKEENPKITLMQARKELLNNGIHLSLEGIIKILKRYGLVGYDKKKQTPEIVPQFQLSKNVILEIKRANEILDKNNDIRESAKILNCLPFCGSTEILHKIPYKYLELRRRVEKIPFLFGKEPLYKFYKRAHLLRLALERKKLFYSSLRVGIRETNALFWLGKSNQMLNLIRHLEDRMSKQGDPVLSFLFHLLKGMALARVLKLGSALECANQCKRLIKNFSDPKFYIGLGNLYSNIGMYLQAREYFELAVENISSQKGREICLLSLAGCYTLNGEYHKALNILKRLDQKEGPAYTLIPLAHAQALFGLGKLVEAEEQVKQAIEITKKDEIVQYLHTATMVLSAIYCSRGERKRAISLIKNMVPLLKKNRMMQDYYIRRLYISKQNISVPKKYQSDPFIELILLMKKANENYRLKDYKRAFRSAERRGLTGYLHRLCIFNPEVISKLMQKGKKTGLPRTLLKFSVFNKKVPIYKIKFLGNLIVYKNQKYLKTKLKPKDAAFLIYLCHKTMEPKMSLDLNEVYTNFWPGSDNPSQNLSHLLVRIRKKLRIPSHLLVTTHKGGVPALVNRGIHFTTDYSEFNQILALAKALERADEWGFAKKEYLRAFKLFRGEPFKKMYDNWSDDKRLEIIFSYETGILSFVKKLIKRGKEEQAKKLLKSAEKIIPYSQEIKNLLNEQQNFQL
jgi:transposase/Flp pilus assembly protein TadD